MNEKVRAPNNHNVKVNSNAWKRFVRDGELINEKGEFVKYTPNVLNPLTGNVISRFGKAYKNLLKRENIVLDNNGKLKIRLLKRMKGFKTIDTFYLKHSYIHHSKLNPEYQLISSYDDKLKLANTVVECFRKNRTQLDKVKIKNEDVNSYGVMVRAKMTLFFKDNQPPSVNKKFALGFNFSNNINDKDIVEEVLTKLDELEKKSKESDADMKLEVFVIDVYTHNLSLEGGCASSEMKKTHSASIDKSLSERMSLLWKETEPIQIKNYHGVNNNCGIQLLFKVFGYDKENNEYKKIYDPNGNYGKGKLRTYRNDEIRKECNLELGTKLKPSQLIELCETFFNQVVEKFDITIFDANKLVLEQRIGNGITKSSFNILLLNDHYYQVLGKSMTKFIGDNNTVKKNAVKKWVSCNNNKVNFEQQANFIHVNPNGKMKILYCHEKEKIISTNIEKFVEYIYKLDAEIHDNRLEDMYFIALDIHYEMLEAIFNEIMRRKRKCGDWYYDDCVVIIRLQHIQILNLKLTIRGLGMDSSDLVKIREYAKEFNKQMENVMGESFLTSPYIAVNAYREWTKSFLYDSMHTVQSVDKLELNPDASIYYLGDMKLSENWDKLKIMRQATYGAPNYILINEWGDENSPPTSHTDFFDSEKYKKYLDINSCFPASMLGDIKGNDGIELLKDTFYPCGEGCLSFQSEEKFHQGYLGFYYIRYKANKKLKFYPIPRKVKKHSDEASDLIYDLNDGEGYYTNVDIQSAIDLSYTIEFVNDKQCYIYPCKSNPFKTYITKMYDNKVKSKEPVKKQFYKEMLNSLYGKLGKKPYKKITKVVDNPVEFNRLAKKYELLKIEELNDELTRVVYEDCEENYKYPKQLMSFVLSYVRSLVIQYVRIITPKLDTIPFSYIDTDSFRVDADGYSNLYYAGLISNKLGHLKDELNEGLVYYEKTDVLKRYVMKYITENNELKEKRTNNWK